MNENEEDEDNYPKGKGELNSPTLKELAIRPNPVRILKFLLNSEEEWNETDIYETIDMNYGVAHYWLERMAEVGILEVNKTKVDGRCRYYQITDKEFAKGVIDRYHWSIGFELARLIPYTKTRESQVRQDERFIALCKDNYLTLDEGIDSVKKCKFIGVVKEYNETYLIRKEQGYDPPSPKQIDLEQAKKAIS